MRRPPSNWRVSRTPPRLRQDEGPGILRSITATARRNFTHRFVQGLFARADARDRLTGLRTREAPRLTWDFLTTVDKLPFHQVARGEYAHVGKKPLGNGFGSRAGPRISRRGDPALR